MADHGKLFSAQMVLALLAGTKTQTRRLLTEARVFATPETKDFTLRGEDLARALQNASRFRRLDANGWFWESDAFEWQAPAERTGWMAHIGYAPGDRLWVRENMTRFDKGTCDQHIWYWAGANDVGNHSRPTRVDGRETVDGPWPHAEGPAGGAPYSVPSIHMPRWASRLTLIVTDVRVQRLQDISEEDARAEGVVPHPNGGFWVPGVEHPNPDFPYLARPTAREMYAALWDVLNGSGAWLANPWVTATSFEVHRKNIDAMEGADG